MSAYGGSAAALRAAARRLAQRPYASALVIGALACVLACVALAGAAAWRSAPWLAPAWMQPEALVLAAGAEGETDLAALRNALRAALPQPAPAASFDFIGRDAALRELAQRRSLAGSGLAELRPNPLPDAFRLRFAAGTPPDQVEAAVAALRKVRGVEAVEYDAELVRRAALLGALSGRFAQLLAALLAAALLLAAIVAATFWAGAPDEELAVLHLLGAEPAQMVRPAAWAAGLCLLCAALLAWGIAAELAALLDPALADLAQHYGLHWDPLPLPGWTAGLLCLVFAGAGTIGTGLALRLALQRRLARGLLPGSPPGSP
jgi:cell division transport system permease protein